MNVTIQRRRQALVLLLSVAVHGALLGWLSQHLQRPAIVIQASLSPLKVTRQQQGLAQHDKTLHAGIQSPKQPAVPKQPATPPRPASPKHPATPTPIANTKSPTVPAAPRASNNIAQNRRPRPISTAANTTNALSPAIPAQPEAPMTTPTTRALTAPTEVQIATQGHQPWSSDPHQRHYQQQLMAHLRSRLIAPAGLRGEVRLELVIRYGSMATEVRVIVSSGSRQVDDWAIRAVLAANPFPPVPDHLPQPFVFRPTLNISPTPGKDRG